ncbi:hypothetical protein GCM10010486_18280 [Nonomuraea roseoviolacea subsp. carminata]
MRLAFLQVVDRVPGHKPILAVRMRQHPLPVTGRDDRCHVALPVPIPAVLVCLMAAIHHSGKAILTEAVRLRSAYSAEARGRALGRWFDRRNHARLA